MNYENIMKTVTECFEKAGVRFLYKWEDFGLNNHYPSRSGKVELHMDYGDPAYLSTPDGDFTFGSKGYEEGYTLDKAISILNQYFTVDVLKEKRNDVFDRSSIEYQCGISGPVYTLSDRLTKEGFRAWLETHLDLIVVGEASDSYLCPLALYLNSQTSVEWFVHSVHYGVRNTLVEAALPEWAMNFTRLVDESGSLFITAWHALRILDQS